MSCDLAVVALELDLTAQQPAPAEGSFRGQTVSLTTVRCLTEDKRINALLALKGHRLFIPPEPWTPP